MTQARREHVDPEVTPYYHCISRCVRRAFLCGQDAATGQDFDHRKQWVVDRLALLSEVFTVRVCAYAVMSNHLHVVLGVDLAGATRLGEQEVLKRYGRLFKASARAAEQLPDGERAERIALFRRRLADLSWFMRSLNEYMARRANQEDGCRGRFWEGRFRCQALLDEAAVLTCMSYVDLNPVRAGLAETLEDSDFTSIKQRLQEAAGESRKEATPAVTLLPCAPVDDAGCDAERLDDIMMLPLSLAAYVELLVSTGQVLREDKKGVLSPQAATILKRFGINDTHWGATVAHFHTRFSAMVGSVDRLQKRAEHLGRQNVRGRRFSQALYRAAV